MDIKNNKKQLKIGESADQNDIFGLFYYLLDLKKNDSLKTAEIYVESKAPELLAKIGETVADALYGNNFFNSGDPDSKKWIHFMDKTAMSDIYGADACLKLGMHFFKDGDFTQALVYLQRGSELFDSMESTIALGSMYENGNLGEPNYIEAEKWYVKAAEMSSDDDNELTAEKIFESYGPPSLDFSLINKWANDFRHYELYKSPTAFEENIKKYKPKI